MRQHVLGRDVARGATEGVGAHAVLQHLGKSKVAQLDVALLVDEHVLRLQVAVHGVVLMQVGERQCEAAHVKAGQALIHALEHLDLGRQAAALQVSLGHTVLDNLGLRDQHVHKVTGGEQIKQKVQVHLVLEGGVLADAERMRRVLCDSLLAKHVLRAVRHRRLAHALERVHAARGGLLHNSDAAEGTAAQHPAFLQHHDCVGAGLLGERVHLIQMPYSDHRLVRTEASN
mmetsp:Transcript_35567/g.92389  ORF Transcript_35567/g.92389 Transcript_35567/m.92389 type:complete len:230 (+) Transcript_35567:529-1218(+)